MMEVVEMKKIKVGTSRHSNIKKIPLSKYGEFTFAEIMEGLK